MRATTVSALRLIIRCGASFLETITWKDAAGVLMPFPVGTEAEVKVRPVLASVTVLLRFSTDPGPTDGLIVLTNPGVTTLSLTAAQTAALEPTTNAVFDIKYTFPGSPPVVVFKLNDGQGLVDIQQVVTRP